MAFAPEYVTCVLHENFEDAKALFLAPLTAINYAHLVMLADREHVEPGLLGQEPAVLEHLVEDLGGLELAQYQPIEQMFGIHQQHHDFSEADRVERVGDEALSCGCG